MSGGLAWVSGCWGLLLVNAIGSGFHSVALGQFDHGTEVLTSVDEMGVG